MLTSAVPTPEIHDIRSLTQNGGQVEVAPRAHAHFLGLPLHPYLQMAARTSTKAFARRNLLQSFLERESPASLPSTSQLPNDAAAVPGPFAAASNPFAPTKVAGANSWTAPRYSLRRQKVLRRELESFEGAVPDHVLPPPYKKQHVQTRRTPPQRMYRSSPHIPESKVLDELDLVKKGPYAGRKGMAFKGKLWERKFEKRQQQLKAAFESADERAQQWKKVRSPSSAPSARPQS